MSQQGGGKEQGLAGDFGAILMGALLIMGGLYFFWMYNHEKVVSLSIMIREPILHLVGFISDRADMAASRVGRVDAEAMDFNAYKNMMSETGSIVRWFYLPLILGAIMYVFFNSFSSRFRKRHSMSSLAQQEKKIWPEISPVVNLDLVAEDPFKGKWAVSMSEREFARQHGLIEADGSINREKAARVFSMQMGPIWTGEKNLAPHVRALFAVFCMRIGGDSKGALAALRKIAVGFEKEPFNPDYSWVDEQIAKHGENELVKKAISRHAYVFTVMATLLQLARLDGVLASPMWIWLKPYDRKLFYVLNCVGRYADFVEVSGATAHWKMEKKVGMRVPFPCVEEAVKGLELALKDYCDDDYLEKIFE